MKNNNVKNIIFAIIAVVLMIVIVGGSTFAYFQWTTAENQKTSVNVTIEQGKIVMHIEPEQTVFEGLHPTANCATSVAYGDALVTITNNTGTLAIPSFKLSASVTKSVDDVDLTAKDLAYIHYAVASVGTQVVRTPGQDDVVKKLSTVNGSCSSPLTAAQYVDDETTLFETPNLIATGTFADVVSPTPAGTTGTDLPLAQGVFLPRQYNLNTGEVSGVTFKAEAGVTSYQYFRVYIWIDEQYTTTTIGNTVSDPLQNAKIEITWSTNSMIEQVAY